MNVLEACTIEAKRTYAIGDIVEFIALILIYAGFVIVGLHVITNGGFQGQDFYLHLHWTARGIRHPDTFFLYDSTNPPLLYMVGGLWFHTLGKLKWIDASSIFFLTLNTVSLHFCYLISWKLIKSRLLRLACLATLAFLPLTVLTSLIYAPDALSALPFFIFVFSLMKIIEKPSSPMLWSTIAGIAFAVGAFAKYTFATLIPAAIAVVLLIDRCLSLTWKTRLTVLTLAIVIPGCFAASLSMHAHRMHYHVSTFPHLSGGMTINSLLFPKRNDLYLLTAPSLGEPIIIDGAQARVDLDGKPQPGGRPGYEIVVNNVHSYPGLLHYAVHTDYLNIAYLGLLDGAAPERPPANQLLQTLSVKLGLPFSVLVFLSVPYALASIAILAWRGKSYSGDTREILNLAALLVPALAFFLAIVLMLPFLIEAYWDGYWTPRLVFPAILSFGIVMFYALDRLFAFLGRNYRKAKLALQIFLVTLVLESCLVHILLLWR